VEDAKLLKQAIHANPQLSVLKLSYNALGDEGAAIIASALQLPNGEHHGHLSVLDLGFNSIGDKGCEALAVHGLAGNYTLQTLYLSGNNIGEKGALSIAGAILHGSALLNLYLSANKLGPIGMKAIAGAIAKNDILVSSLGAIEAASKSAHSMQELHVGSSSIRSEGFLAIPRMLLTNSSLRSLCVVNNGIDDDDLALLAQALSQNKNLPLETLRLSFNEITCAGVEHLMNSIWGSPTLRELKLDNNKIQDRGAQLCAVVLTSIPLEILDLSLNRITTVGIKALMKNLSENTSLLSLGLTGITIDQNASKAVSFALAYNSTLQAIYIDNCSAGYASQRHIVAGVVSNRTSSLRVLAGFHLARKFGFVTLNFVLVSNVSADQSCLSLLPRTAIAITLGMPRLPPEWSNDQVLGFFRLMWQQWLFKAGRGSNTPHDTRGPAPPAAVAAAAKIALTSLGSAPFYRQPHGKPVGEGPPVDPVNRALLERTDSGTLCVPVFADSSDDLELVVDDVQEAANDPSSSICDVQGPLDNAERRNQNLKWLRQHFRSLNDVGKLPFNNADLWQLHQYYFSPPYQHDDRSSTGTESDGERSLSGESADAEGCAPPPTPSRMSKSPSLGRAVSFQALGDAFAASEVMSKSNIHKRRSFKPDEEDDGPASKRAKSLKPRIAYYPRIMVRVCLTRLQSHSLSENNILLSTCCYCFQVQLESLGKRPMEQTLALLRQLKYTENVMFAGSKDPYTNAASSIREEVRVGKEEPSHSDVEMILLDLL
jgi:Ran GTPase-activating protein (RanGAP) involved in mRNA processing and transport